MRGGQRRKGDRSERALGELLPLGAVPKMDYRDNNQSREHLGDDCGH